jgi:hypothetical protein
VPDFSQLPGVLNLFFVPTDEVSISLNLQRNVTNYTFTSVIYQTNVNTTGGGLGVFSSIGETITAPTIGIANATTGAMVLGLSEQQTALIYPEGSYRWFLRWVAPGEITRTIISGSVTAVRP